MYYQHSTHSFSSRQDQAAIYWQRWTPTDAIQRILVFQHGIGEHAGRYGSLIDALAETGTAVYALDARGHGNTVGLRGHVQDFAVFSRDLGQLIEIAREENKQQQVFLLGHSLGGAIALQYALTAGNQAFLRGLLLSSPAIEIPLSATAYLKKQLSPLLVRLMPSAIIDTELDVRLLSHDPQVAKDFTNDTLTHGKISIALAHALTRLHKAFYARAASLHIPVYIAHGTGDRITSAEGSKKLYRLLRQPDKTLRLYDDLYHEMMHEKEPDRQRVLADMKNWLISH